MITKFVFKNNTKSDHDHSNFYLDHVLSEISHTCATCQVCDTWLKWVWNIFVFEHAVGALVNPGLHMVKFQKIEANTLMASEPGVCEKERMVREIY
jgi:hypothetical protein